MNNGILPVYRNQSYSLYGEYKSTVREFFSTLSLNHNRGWSDRIFEQQVRDGQVSLVSHRLSNYSSGWTVKGTLSKGFYDWGLKTSLSYLLGRNNAEQLSAGERLPYRYDFMQYEPKLIWSPLRSFSASYQATIYLGRSKIGTGTRLDPLLNVVQKFQLSYELFPVEINLSADHYHNDVSRDKSVNAFFAGLFLRWKWEAGSSQPKRPTCSTRNSIATRSIPSPKAILPGSISVRGNLWPRCGTSSEYFITAKAVPSTSITPSACWK